MGPDRGRLVADQVRDGEPHAAVGPRARGRPRHHFVHPRAAPLGVGAGVGVEVERGDRGPATRHLEEAGVRVPHGRAAVGRGHGDAKQAGRQGEQAVEDRGEGEIGAQRFVGQVVLGLAQALGVKGDVPVGERRVGEAGLLGKGRHLRQLLFRRPARGAGQLVEQPPRRRQRGHLGRHRQVGVAVEAEQGRLFAAQGEDLFDDRRVFFRRARLVRAIHLLPQLPAGGMRHDGDVNGGVQGEEPGAGLGRRAGVAGGRGLLRGKAQGRRGEAGDDRGVGHDFLKGFRRVQHGVGERGGQLREFLLNFVKPRFGRPIQRHAAQREIAQLVVDQAALGGGEGGPGGGVGFERGQRVAQRARLREAQRESDALGLHLVHGGAEFFGIADGFQVVDRAPRGGKAVAEAFDGFHDARPRRRGGRLERVQAGRQVGQERADAGHDVAGLDAVKGGVGRVLGGEGGREWR